jgi:hypothetical protein
MRSKRNGFAAVYGLLVLLLVTVCGTALLFLTRKSRESIADYSASEVSVMAANAALKAVEKQLLANAAMTVTKLTKFAGDTNYRYLFKGAATSMNVDTTITFDGKIKYSAKILKFNQAKSLLLVEGAGYDGLGSKKKVTALYKLDGLYNGTPAYPSAPGGIKAALYLGGGLENLNSPMNIIGNMYLGPYTGTSGGTNLFNSSGTVTITGDLKTFVSTSTCMTINSTFSVSGNAYLQAPISGTMTVAGTKYSTPNSGTNQAPDTLVWSAAMTSVQMNVNNNFTVANLESWWSTQKSANKLYNGFLVLNMTGDVGINASATAFTKKVIWKTNQYAINANGQWYTCADTSNTLIYVNSSGYFSGLGVPANGKFRGLIYVNSSYAQKMTVQCGSNSTFYGAICFVDGVMDLNSGTLKIDYGSGSLGETAVQEFIDIGVLHPGN